MSVDAAEGVAKHNSRLQPSITFLLKDGDVLLHPVLLHPTEWIIYVVPEIKLILDSKTALVFVVFY